MQKNKIIIKIPLNLTAEVPFLKENAIVGIYPEFKNKKAG